MEAVSKRGLPSNLLSIDLIRGLASLWVVIFHINEPIPYQSNWWTDFCKLGWLGVPAFFVVSGFCMGMLENRSKPGAFLVSRLARIYPPYLASLGVVIAAAAVLRLTNGVNDAVVIPRDIADWAATLLLLLDPVTSVPSINWVYWSLVIEVCFYFYFAFCLNFGKTRTLWFLLPLLLYPWHDIAVFSVKPLVWIEHYPVFIVGYFLYRSLTGAQTIERIAFGSMLVACILSRSVAESIVVITTMLVIFALRDWQGAFAKRAIQFFGRISYSLYLVHVPVACYVLLKARNEFLEISTRTHFLVDMILVAMTILVAAVFYHLIELPSHRWSRELQRN